MQRPALLHRLGTLLVRQRRLVLAASAVFFVLAAVLGTRAFGVLQDGGFNDPNAESERAAAYLAENFGGGDPNVVLVVTMPEGTGVDDPTNIAAAADVSAALDAVTGVDSVVSYWSLGGPDALRTDDGDRALILARIQNTDVGIALESIRADVAGGAVAAGSGFELLVGGREAVFDDIGHTIERDLGRAELVAIPLTLLLLLFVFRGLIAASLPLLVGVLAVFGTFLSLYVIGSITDVSVYAINLTTALGLGLAIDYSLFVVSRFREQLAAGDSVEQAVVRTVETAGRTVLISALTVAASLAALLVFPLYFLRSFAYAGTAVVVMALGASLITLPALLAVIGTRVDALRIGRRRHAVAGVGAGVGPGVGPGVGHGVGAGDGSGGDADGFWHRLAMFVMRRPVPIAVGVVAILLLLGSPFLRVNFASGDDRALPTSAESRQASDLLRSEFSGNASESFGVLARTLPGEPAAAEEAITETASALSLRDGVARVESAAGVFIDGSLVQTDPSDARYRNDTVGATWFSVVPSFALTSSRGEDLVNDIRSLDLPLDVAVEGAAADLVDTKAAIGGQLPLALAIIVLATFVLLFLLSGSILVPIKALVLNVLSLTATFGAMVWIFQDGNLSGLLGFTATGAIDTSMPILMFCIAFGLSMDYEVFMLSRIKEEHDRTGDNIASVALGLERTGRIVTAAAALLAITFFAFGTSDVSFIKMFGIGLGLAVLMDATIVRGFLVPAFMRLAGEANWWAPAPLRRFHDRFGLREGDAHVASSVRAASPALAPSHPEVSSTGTTLAHSDESSALIRPSHPEVSSTGTTLAHADESSVLTHRSLVNRHGGGAQ